jgi:hypothetical protein
MEKINWTGRARNEEVLREGEGEEEYPTYSNKKEG